MEKEKLEIASEFLVMASTLVYIKSKSLLPNQVEDEAELTEEELIQIANITQKQYDSVILDKSYCQSLDTPITDDSSTKLEDVVPDTSSETSDIFTI